MHKLIPCLRLLDSGHFTSGEVIAERLGISRASVSNSLSHAEDYGLAVERRHGLGYRVKRPVEWLDHAAIRAALPAESILQIEILEQAESTNRMLLADPRHGRVLVAEWQSGGRGRMGRKWLGALGGSLLFSLAWTFPEGPARLAGLPLAVGAALARAIESAGVSQIGLKWPNDLLLPAGKAGGILIEMQGDALGPAQVVIGVGLNLHLPENLVPVDQPVAALAGHGLQLGRNALLGRILAELERTLPRFAAEGFAPLRSEWEIHHAWQNQPAEIHMPDGRKLAGTIAGVSDQGALQMLIDGKLQLIHSGDVSLRKARA